VEFVFSLHGTKGDILPFVCLAEELMARGNQATFIANEYFGEILKSLIQNYLK